MGRLSFGIQDKSNGLTGERLVLRFKALVKWQEWLKRRRKTNQMRSAEFGVRNFGNDMRLARGRDRECGSASSANSAVPFCAAAVMAREKMPRISLANLRGVPSKRLRTSGFGSEKELSVQVIDFSPVITIFHIISPIFHPISQPEGFDFSRVRRFSRGKLCDLARGENASEEIGIGNGGVAPTFKA
jgi:hypothetical protein